MHEGRRTHLLSNRLLSDRNLRAFKMAAETFFCLLMRAGSWSMRELLNVASTDHTYECTAEYEKVFGWSRLLRTSVSLALGVVSRVVDQDGAVDDPRVHQKLGQREEDVVVHVPPLSASMTATCWPEKVTRV